MSGRSLRNLETALQDISDLIDEPTQARFMAVVAQLEAHCTEAALGILFARFANEPGDIMERLIHGVENFPGKMYTRALARELLPLSRRAREWTVILHMRLLQSRKDLSWYVDNLVGAGPEIQAALHDILGEVATRRADLARVVARTIDATAARRSLYRHAENHRSRRSSTRSKRQQ